MDYLEWRHVFKLDPAKDLSDEALEKFVNQVQMLL